MFKGSPVHIFPFLMYFNPLKQDFKGQVDLPVVA